MDTHWPDWIEDASCRSAGVDGFYPEGMQGDWKTPRRVCDGCTAVLACRDWVMGIEVGVDYRHRFGIIGGLSPLERFRLEPTWLAEQQGAA